MSVTYRNAPLVELIAELRWVPFGMGQFNPVPGALMLQLPTSKDEEVFMHFAALAAKAGYGRLERLIPPGLPIPPQQAACRFRPTSPEKQSPLLQIGSGVFTANGMPPDYQSWHSFVPRVSEGVEVLFNAYRGAGLNPPNISEVLIRYVDVFEQRHMGGRSLQQFLRDVLGLRIELPKAIMSASSSEDAPVPTIQFQIPVRIGVMNVLMGLASRPGPPAFGLDTSIIVQREVGPDANAAISALTEAREIIHDMFRSLTTDIHGEMGPQ